MTDRPFEILQLLNGNSSASNGMVTVISEVPCHMFRPRGIQIGTPGIMEMLCASLTDGTKVYVRQQPDNTVTIRITKRQILRLGI